MVILGVLKEELNNSLQIKREYEKDLARIPKGSLIRRERKGHFYYYLQFREGNKVKQIYKGKLAKEEISIFNENKALRKKMRHLLSDLNKQIKFLRGVLREKRTNRAEKTF
ncbi:MAG: hypothetical protein KKG84_06425 [Candidatus Omnitrophica bacterium]|nr:hypothetical protein [Candidatus Omnitrophota bacterium]